MANTSPTSGEPVRVALIGCATAGIQKAQCITEKLSNRAALVVACDVDEDAARRGKETLRVNEHCTHPQEVMERKDVDAVMIAIPPVTIRTSPSLRLKPENTSSVKSPWPSNSHTPTR